uniref:Uncharacterized protein n=1 Tax=Brassica oleracea var. oleracea TaxID=109376 RepID=A0A0D3BVV7_BRAOL
MPIARQEAAGLQKRVKRIHDPVTIFVPCAVIEVEFPTPRDRSVHLDSYSEILDDHQHVEASQRGLRFQDDVDKGPAEPVSIDTERIPSIDTNKPTSIDTTTSPSIDTTASTSIGAITSPSIDTGRVLEQKNLMGIPPRDQTNGVWKSRVRSKCFSQPFAKLRAFLIAEMIDKGEESMEEAFTQE